MKTKNASLFRGVSLMGLLLIGFGLPIQAPAEDIFEIDQYGTVSDVSVAIIRNDEQVSFQKVSRSNQFKPVQLGAHSSYSVWRLLKQHGIELSDIKSAERGALAVKVGTDVVIAAIIVSLIVGTDGAATPAVQNTAGMIQALPGCAWTFTKALMGVMVAPPAMGYIGPAVESAAEKLARPINVDAQVTDAFVLDAKVLADQDVYFRKDSETTYFDRNVTITMDGVVESFENDLAKLDQEDLDKVGQ